MHGAASREHGAVEVIYSIPTLSRLTTEHGAVGWALQQRPYGHMDTTKAITHIGLCAGYGGIELGLKRAIPDLRTVALCEIEAFAISNLVAKMEAGFMDPAPIWPNLKTFPWGAFRDRVDILTGGYPCQPFSAAGQRRGKDDPRHLWPYIADGIRLLRPRCCFFENVEGHISLGLSDVIEDLAGMGYRTTWGIFSASECGAPHQRKRVFILAHNDSERSQELARQVSAQSNTPPLGTFVLLANSSSQRSTARLPEQESRYERQSGITQHSGCEAWPSRPGEQQYGWEPPRVVGGLAHTASQRGGSESGDALHQGWTASEAGTESVPQDTGWQDGTAIADDQPTGGDGAELADTGSIARGTSGRQLQSEQLEEGGRHSEATESGSGNNHGPAGEELGDTEGRDGLGSAQWDSGHAAQPDEGAGSGQTQPALGGDPDGPPSGLDYAELCVTCDNRTDELRLLGNGVVPHTSELAFRVLIQELANE